MSYVIPLSEIGRSLYAKRDPDVERAVIFLVEVIGIDEWQTRRADIATRFGIRLKRDPAAMPVEGVSVRDQEDEIGWYIYLCETSIGDPPAVNSDQLSRVAPYLSAFGRKIDSITAIGGIDERIREMVRRVKDRDPDQALFEMLVGAAYVMEGWSVTAIPESPTSKTPDFLVVKGSSTFEVECKRMARRGEYTSLERDAWLRLWKPVSQWLASHRYAWVFTIRFHIELVRLPAAYLIDAIQKGMREIADGKTFEDGDRCSISAVRTNIPAIKKHLETNYLKVNCAAERELIGGRYDRDYGFTNATLGRTASMGPRENPGNTYWTDIDYAHAAFWRCDAPEALEKKARDVKTRLSRGVEQLTGRYPGVVHIGIETAEGDDVELVRSQKILKTVQSFNRGAKPLEWIYLHYFRGESVPNEDWGFDETIQRAGYGWRPDFPLRAELLVGPESVDTREGAHWTPELCRC